MLSFFFGYDFSQKVLDKCKKGVYSSSVIEQTQVHKKGGRTL